MSNTLYETDFVEWAEHAEHQVQLLREDFLP